MTTTTDVREVVRPWRADRSAGIEDDSDVQVDTSGNTVTLGGHVRTWAEHDAGVSAAWMARGVIQVRDYLDVTG
jgi:osmotically-inducible protein OsmY